MLQLGYSNPPKKKVSMSHTWHIFIENLCLIKNNQWGYKLIFMLHLYDSMTISCRSLTWSIRLYLKVMNNISLVCHAW